MLQKCWRCVSSVEADNILVPHVVAVDGTTRSAAESHVKLGMARTRSECRACEVKLEPPVTSASEYETEHQD